FSKVLIANRGEIAVRVIRAARDEGLATVAVHADPDRAAEHVRQADEAFSLGGSSAQESYLVAEKILEAARAHGADAVHPVTASCPRAPSSPKRSSTLGWCGSVLRPPPSGSWATKCLRASSRNASGRPWYRAPSSRSRTPPRWSASSGSMDFRSRSRPLTREEGG